MNGTNQENHNTERDALLRAKADKAEVKFKPRFHGNPTLAGPDWFLCFDDTAYPIATAFLGVLNPDAVVVKIDDICFKCMMGFPGKRTWVCTLGFDDGKGNPGPNCPIPAKPGKKWILVEVPE